MATETRLPVYRGEDVTIPFTYSPTTDITNFTHTFTLARDRNISTKLLSKTCTTTDAAAGSFSAALTAAELEAIEPGIYFWDVWRVDSGNHRLVGLGSFDLSPNVRIPTA